MKKMLTTSAVVVAFMASTAWGDASVSHRKNSNYSTTAEVVDATSHTPLAGASTLERLRNSVRMSLHTSGLEPGGAYTVWWVVFNRPQKCSDKECGLDDVFVNPAPARTSVLWAGGSIAGYDGVASFYGTLRKHRSLGEVLFGPGLENVKGAEIHLVVRNHGQPLIGDVGAQLSTFGGGCDINDCRDEQASIHAPAMRTHK